MTPQDPTAQVLAHYANEALQLRLEVAHLQAQLAEATKDTEGTGDAGDDPA